MTAKPVRGSFRIRRDLRRLGLGMLQISAHTRSAREYARRNAVVGKLIDDAQVEVLRALQSGRVTVEQLVDLDRRNELTGSRILGTVAMRQPLWETWRGLLAGATAKKSTSQRYLVTAKQLERVAPQLVTVGDLLGVDWASMARAWEGSPSDWNHVRRGVSRFLTLLLGDKYHPTRRQIVASIPIKKERQRVPDLSPAVFWRIIGHAREDVRAVFIALAGTGLRVRSEYLRLSETDLMPATHQLRVSDEGKTGGRIVSVAPELWGYIKAAVPSPLQYKALRRCWMAACQAAGVSGVTLHDLRHSHAQWATDFGAQLTQVQGQLGHTTPLMTARYAQQRDSRATAVAVGKAMRRRAR